MQSSREDFLDEREQEAFNNPLDFQQPEERKPMCIDDWLEKYEADRKAKYEDKYGDLPYHLNLDARSSDHANGRIRQELAKYGKRDIEFINRFYNKQSIKIDKQLVYHNHAKPMTDYERIHHVPSSSQAEKDLRIKKLNDGFKNLRTKSRRVDNV